MIPKLFSPRLQHSADVHAAHPAQQKVGGPAPELIAMKGAGRALEKLEKAGGIRGGQRGVHAAKAALAGANRPVLRRQRRSIDEGYRSTMASTFMRGRRSAHSYTWISFGVRPIAVGARRRHHQERNGRGGLIHELMSRSRRNLEALPRVERESRTLDFQHRLAFQDVEKLPGGRVKMPAFPITGGHAFLYHTELRAIEQMPSLACGAPPIVLARIDVHDSHGAPLPLLGDSRHAARPLKRQSAP